MRRSTRHVGSECNIMYGYSNITAGGKQAVPPPGRPTDVDSFSSIGSGTVSVVATEEEVLGAIQTSRANSGEGQANRNRMPGRSERFSGIQE